MRVYVAASPERLRSWVENRAVPPGAEGRYVAAEEDEESEYAALMAAAAESRRERAQPRFVVVAELPGADPDAGFGFDRVVAVHADDHEGAADDEDLGWYTPEELADLLS